MKTSANPPRYLKRALLSGFALLFLFFSTPLVRGVGQLGIVQSSARYKDDIKPMNKADEAILTLTPVTFRYKEELDPEKIPQFGLVAEDLENLDSELVIRDEEGKPFAVRYEANNAMLLNEFLKEHGTLQQQFSELQQQDTTIRRLNSLIAEQKSGWHTSKANRLPHHGPPEGDQMDLITSSPRVVAENR